MSIFLRYPIPFELKASDKIALKFGYWFPISCPVCGNISAVRLCYEPLRETCVCKNCGSTNRQRQIAYIICDAFSKIKHDNIKNLKQLSEFKDINIYSTESQGALHNMLENTQNYMSSEYFGDQYISGTYINGTLHEDLMKLSFLDNSFDLVISGDVMEHVYDPYKAYREIYRVLKPGGRHIFSVPFDQCDFLDIQYATVGENGEIIHIKEPWYHIDPIRSEGALVFKIFSLEMLVELRKIGFYTNFYHLHSPLRGIFGPNALIFEAIKI